MSKNGKTALVPRLRFNEFVSTGEWKVYKLNNIADRLTEKVGNRQLTTLSISAGVGFVSQNEKFSRDISGKQYENYIYLKKGDFSYNKGNSKKFPQGCIYELNEYDEAAVPNAFISFHFHDDYVPHFYKGYFENNFHGKQLMKFITSGARMDGLLNINPLDFFSIILPTPKEKSEQQKIADCLSSIDDLIAAEEKKLEAFKTHKKGLMQKMFPAEGRTVPEWRFPEFRDSGDWESSALNEVCKKIAQGGTPNTSISEYWNGEINWLTPAEMGEATIPFLQTTNRKITDLGLKNCSSILLPINSVIISTRAPIGYLKINLTPMAINQGCKALIPNNRLNYLFLYYLLCINITSLKNLGAGNTFKELSGNALKSFRVIFPSVPEQQKIADCLSSIDELVTEQAKKIEALKLHKKGLMQGLFPSITEVGE